MNFKTKGKDNFAKSFTKRRSMREQRERLESGEVGGFIRALVHGSANERASSHGHTCIHSH